MKWVTVEAVSFRSAADQGITETLQHSKELESGAVGSQDVGLGWETSLIKGREGKKNSKNHGSEGTPNYIDTLYIARVIVTIIQAGTYCTELKLYGFKKLVYILSDY